jgi:hypothetical protein
MIFTTVLQWSIFAFSIASKNDLDDQNLLLATVHTVAEMEIRTVLSFS